MTNPMMMNRAFTALLLLGVATGCATEDIPPGNQGFMFDRTGPMALYIGGSGMQTDVVLKPGTHYTGLYDEVRDINCKDAETRETVAVLTQSDLTVEVDMRITYSADCTTRESLVKILDQVPPSAKTNSVEPDDLYSRYILPILRASLRNRLAAVTIEDVKKVREDLRRGIAEDVDASIKETANPVRIRILTVSDIRLPIEIIEKNRQIELARQEAEQEREKQNAAKSRLERELFEAQQDRKVQREQAEKAKEVAEINAARDKAVSILRADADLEVKRREAEGIAAVRAELSGPYLQYLSLLKEAEIRKAMAEAMAHSNTKWYIDKDFLVPPGSNANVAVPGR
ncbi:MAG: SPFH domain-containing protein [Myxococcota bacterium]